VTDTPAAEVVARLTASGQTLAVAESLTGGLVAATVVEVPGASVVLRGAVVAYATDLKHGLLGVDGDLLSRVGPVAPDVAVAMATGVRHRLGATYGIATTGVAGPDPQGDRPVGLVYMAASGPDGVRVKRLQLVGDRRAIRDGTVRGVLALLLEALDG
jgi:nicotinamide-nucleotide amidase